MQSVGDRAKETTVTSGTGNVTLAGAVTQFQSINSAIPLNILFGYAIVEQGGTAFETGIGYLSNATTLVRVTVLTSSNANALVNFAVGTTKDVFVSLNAQMLISRGVQQASSTAMN